MEKTYLLTIFQEFSFLIELRLNDACKKTECLMPNSRILDAKWQNGAPKAAEQSPQTKGTLK